MIQFLTRFVLNWHVDMTCIESIALDCLRKRVTQGVESQCDRHDAVESGLQIPLPLSARKHLCPFFAIDVLSIIQNFESRSDSNSYFPIGPCEYGGPLQALMAGDANAGSSSHSL